MLGGRGIGVRHNHENTERTVIFHVVCKCSMAFVNYYSIRRVAVKA